MILSFFKYLYSLIPPYPNNSPVCNENLELRISIDAGSGGTKTSAAVYDLQTNTYLKNTASENIKFKYQHHISQSKDKSLSHDFMQEGLKNLLDLIDSFKIADICKTKVSGIATAWARNATNSDQYLNILKDHDIFLKPVSQYEEGLIGYKAVTSTSDMTQDEVCVFDIGGGSFQIIHKHGDYIKVFEGPYGSANFASEAQQHVNFNNHEAFFTPEQTAQALDFAKHQLHDVLHDIPFDSVEGIGNFLNLNIQPLVQKNHITISEVSSLVNEFTQLSVDDAKAKYSTIGDKFIRTEHTNLILLQTIMEGLGLDQINFNSSKTKDYILHDETFWEDSNPMCNNEHILYQSITETPYPEAA